MASNAYEQIYGMVRNGYTGDSSIWDRTYDYLREHPNDLFYIAPKRRWSIGHQIVYHGGLQLLKRLLELYNEETINIFSVTNDTPKALTILDIARDRKGYYKEQYEYIEHLFAQDKFLRACKELNWPIIDEMLEKDKRLLNEKPPYYSNYFIHYLVEFGDTRRLAQYDFPENHFQYDLKNADGKTALDLAHELNNNAMVDEIKQALPSRRSAPVVPVENDRDEERDRTPPPPPPRRPPLPPSSSSSSQNCNGNVSSTNPLSEETLKKMKCSLTKKIFVDPVVASDGCTYERKAITEYLRNNPNSPVTGEIIDHTFTENTLLKNIIGDLRKQNLLPK